MLGPAYGKSAHGETDAPHFQCLNFFSVVACFKLFVFKCVCVHAGEGGGAWICAYAMAAACRAQRRALRPLELEFPAVLSCLTWVP